MFKKSINFLLSLVYMLMMAIIFISAMFATRSRGADATDWLPYFIVPSITFMLVVNIIKVKLGFSPMFKKNKKSPDSLFVFVQGAGFIGVSLLLTGNFISGGSIALISIILLFILDKGFITQGGVPGWMKPLLGEFLKPAHYSLTDGIRNDGQSSLYPGMSIGQETEINFRNIKEHQDRQNELKHQEDARIDGQR